MVVLAIRDVKIMVVLAIRDVKIDGRPGNGDVKHTGAVKHLGLRDSTLVRVVRLCCTASRLFTVQLRATMAARLA